MSISPWLTALALAAGLAAPCAAAENPPDVLLISIDDLRADRVRPDLMPNLAALERGSVRFTSAFSQASWTLPSHAALLTSRYPGSSGAGGATGETPRAMFSGIPNLAQLLSARGYSASSFANCSYFRPIFGLVEGFLPRVHTIFLDDPAPDATRWFLNMRSPAFLFFHTYWVHNYINATDAPRDASGAWRCPLRVSPDMVDVAATLSCKDLTLAYDRAAYCLDGVLGKMFADLKAAGRWDKTLVVVTSDHGEALCDGSARSPRRAHLLLPYDEQIHVPLIVKLPGGRLAGRSVESSAELIDVVPTVLEALGLPPASGLQGRSLLPRMESGAPAAADAPVYADMDKGLSIRFEGWKLLRPAAGAPELYDLRADPAETRNLARREPRRAARLQSLLRGHFGRQTAGWRIAVQGRAGSRFTLKASSEKPLALAMTAFGQEGDRLELSADSATAIAAFTIRRDGDEAWLVVETSTPTDRLTLEALRNGEPLPAGAVRLGGKAWGAPGPWDLSAPDARRRGTVPAPPAFGDGVGVWRAGEQPPARPAASGPDIGAELRAAGYLR